jgi:bifunctional non-homologous end joining protein LigD
MAWRAGDRVRLLTRNGVDWTARFPLIYAAVAALKARSCLIDGKRSAAMKTASQSSISCAAGGTTIACSYPLYDLLELDGRRKSIRHGRCVGS